MFEYLILYNGKYEKCNTKKEAEVVLKGHAKENGVDVPTFAEGYCDIYQSVASGELKLCNEDFITE